MFPIFLIREPEGQIWSCLRKNRKYVKLGKSTAGLLRLMKRYVGTNRKNSQACSTSPSCRRSVRRAGA